MAENGHKVLKARSCYGHLGGTLGNRLFERLLELGWLEPEDGRETVYHLTEPGAQAMLHLGVDIYERK